MEWLETKKVDWVGSDVDVVVHYSKRLEAILKEFGASGKGLHQQTNSLESKLPSTLTKELHYVATIRNKIIHEKSSNLDNREQFVQKCKDLEIKLYQALKSNSYCSIM